MSPRSFSGKTERAAEIEPKTALNISFHEIPVLIKVNWYNDMQRLETKKPSWFNNYKGLVNKVNKIWFKLK